LYNQLSFELGFHKEFDNNFFEKEVEYLNSHEEEYQKNKS